MISRALIAVLDHVCEDLDAVDRTLYGAEI